MDGIVGFDRTMALLQQVLNLHAYRHGVIAANIANVDTPGYEPFDVIYADELRAWAERASGGRLAWTHPRHLSGRDGDGQVQPSVVAAQAVGFGSASKGVDIDQEMAKLSEVVLLYNAAAQLLAKKIQLLKYTIDGGGGR